MEAIGTGERYWRNMAVGWISRTWTRIMKRIAFLSILFAALIEFAIERAKFDLWIMIVAMVALLWNLVGGVKE
jgi:hypothetical protein